MNWRIKPLDAILASAEKRSLTRSLGAFQLTMLGVGAIIGTGIFVLTAEAAQKAGPGMMASFVIAGFVCAVTALCYAELAAMVPVSGSAYTYSYAVLGELIAWIVGWALILEYTIAASAVSVGWSNYFVPLIAHSFDIHIPLYLSKGYFAGGLINVPAVFIARAGDHAARARHARERHGECGSGLHQSGRAGAVLRVGAAGRQDGQF